MFSAKAFQPTYMARLYHTAMQIARIVSLPATLLACRAYLSPFSSASGDLPCTASKSLLAHYILLGLGGRMGLRCFWYAVNDCLSSVHGAPGTAYAARHAR